ncbi:hypothetical protein EON68_01305, partial [archaeon]
MEGISEDISALLAEAVAAGVLPPSSPILVDGRPLVVDASGIHADPRVAAGSVVGGGGGLHGAQRGGGEAARADARAAAAAAAEQSSAATPARRHRRSGSGERGGSPPPSAEHALAHEHGDAFEGHAYSDDVDGVTACPSSLSRDTPAPAHMADHFFNWLERRNKRLQDARAEAELEKELASGGCSFEPDTAHSKRTYRGSTVD